MKLVDRYLLRQYLVPCAYCFFAFSLMYVVFDLFGRLSDFLDANTAPWDVAVFYFQFLLTINGNAPFVVLVLPACLLLGALYSLSQLTRHNELTAMRASGMSLPRLMGPFVAVSVVCSLAAAVVQEVAAPDASRWTEAFAKRQNSRPLSTIIPDYPYYNSATHRNWMIRRFDRDDPRRLDGVRVIRERPDGTRAEELRADKAEWLDGRWWFANLRRQAYGAHGEPAGALSRPSDHPVEMTDFTETPEDFANEVANWEYLSSAERLKYIETHPDLSSENRAIKTVDLYSRLAMPWTCMVVVLLGIPAGAKTGRQGVLMGVILAITFFFCFYAAVHLSIFLGKRQVIWPWLSAWLPNMVFAAAGSVMLWRMR